MRRRSKKMVAFRKFYPLRTGYFPLVAYAFSIIKHREYYYYTLNYKVQDVLNPILQGKVDKMFVFSEKYLLYLYILKHNLSCRMADPLLGSFRTALIPLIKQNTLATHLSTVEDYCHKPQ